MDVYDLIRDLANFSSIFWSSPSLPAETVEDANPFLRADLWLGILNYFLKDNLLFIC